MLPTAYTDQHMNHTGSVKFTQSQNVEQTLL